MDYVRQGERHKNVLLIHTQNSLQLPVKIPKPSASSIYNFKRQLLDERRRRREGAKLHNILEILRHCKMITRKITKKIRTIPVVIANVIIITSGQRLWYA